MLERLHRLVLRLRHSAIAFPLALVVAALMLTISEIGYHQAISQLTTLVTRGQTRLELSHLVRRLSDAESGQRGYLLTGQPDYLPPYRDASVSALASLAKLRGFYDKMSDASGGAQLVLLDSDVRTRLSEMDEVMALCESGRSDTARALVTSGIGRDVMARIRAQTEALLDAQNTLVNRGLAYVFDTLLLNRVGVTTMTAVSLLVLGMYLRQRRQSDNERRDQQRLVREERDRLEVQVAYRTAELTQLARHLETAREDERARLARDLHDELGALLTAAKLDLARMRPKLLQAAPELLPRMVHLAEALNSGIALKRRIIEDLRPSSLSTLGLGPALEILVKEFAERLGVQIDAQIDAVALTPSSELTVFRLVQESLNNIAKHARAKHITLVVRPIAGVGAAVADAAVVDALGAAPEHVEVRIQDDGAGFDTGKVGVARHGLVGMRYRVQAEGGVLTVSSQPGQGTAVHASLPAAVASAETESAQPPCAQTPSAHVASANAN
ncbi:MAG: hypothetical protein RJA98_640 [Pseudomonadota bacterium]